MTPGDEHRYVEQPSLELLEALGWTAVDAFEEDFGPAGTLGRDSRADVILVHRLRAAVAALNTRIPADQREEGIDALTRDRSLLDRTRANREVHALLRDGHPVSWRDADGREHSGRIAFVDWRTPQANDLLAAGQVWLKTGLWTRRADVVLYVNGIPLVLLELKEPSRPARAAYDENLCDYRDTVPELFWPNAFVILSNGSEAQVGATFARWEHFGEWRQLDAAGTRGRVQLETALRGTCEPGRLLDLVENFVAYSELPGGLVKTVARWHQVIGVNDSIAALRRIRESGERRLGVFWHTQGSGKSLSMLWFTQKVLRLLEGGWTFVMVTDRKELDDQLHGTFVDAGAVPKEAQVKAASSAHLRELLAADHRYVFTLIHKFRTQAGETEMPVLSDRDDVIVITDEAHRTQYDTLAQNMRRALPQASFMGFTGTPLVVGEEATRREFGDYVSIYNFRDAIADGATVPLYYENRIPELQLVNEAFADELNAVLEAAELDDEAEGQLVRRFGRELSLITRPERLRTIARDIVRHFVGRGFDGKAMVVSVDKATAVRMHDLVRAEWAAHLAEMRAEHDALPPLERAWLASRITLMESTDMAVVVSQAQNEVADMERAGLDIRPHRARMVAEALDERFKDPADPLRLVFVCAMWMTGFDAPSCSTVYLDRPMRNHTLMQTIARANRVFPEKENGLIVDYIGVFRDIERALAIYGAATVGAEIDSPIAEKRELLAALADALAACRDLCARHGIDLDALRTATGFDFIALRDAAVETLIAHEGTRAAFLARARRARKLFKAILPDPGAIAAQSTVAAIRSIAERITDLRRGEQQDIEDAADAVDKLLDRSVGAEEYVIRAAAEGVDPDPLVDLSQLDIEALSARFAGRSRTQADRLAALLRDRAVAAARRNPTRHDLVERIEALIAEYNAGSLNVEEVIRRLIALSQSLTAEEQRAVAEGLSEEELAIFDLLTKPEPVLSPSERDDVRTVARELLAHIHDRLVLDWRRKAETVAEMRVAILDVLDRLPGDPYPTPLWNAKVQAVFEHILSTYGDDGTSPYTAPEGEPEPRLARGLLEQATTTVTALSATDEMIERIRRDPAFAARVAQSLRSEAVTFALSIDELIANDEDAAVEFKSTARWNLRDSCRDRAIEDAVVKTIAGFLNADGGTLLVGVGADRSIVGLAHDYPHVRPQDGDGFVNWLTTHLIEALGAPPTMHARARIAEHAGRELCRVDVGRSARPVWAKTSKEARVFFVRMNNSTRKLDDAEADQYISDHW